MNLHDELGRHGADATAGSSEALTSVEARESLGARVRRGRRRRALGGAGLVAGVLLAAVGLWSVLPVGGAFEPAGNDLGEAEAAVAETWTIDVDGVRDAQFSDFPFQLSDAEGVGALSCGHEWTLDPGVTVHNSDLASDVSASVAASVWRVTDGGSVLAPTSVWAGFETLAWRVNIESATTSSSLDWWSAPVLVDAGGLVAGAGDVEGGWLGAGETAYDAYGPLPGQCPGVDQPSVADGEYQLVFVAQATPAGGAVPALTVVLPLEPAMIEFTGLDTWWNSERTGPDVEGEPAALNPPRGSTYQAFVDPRPEVPGCAPLADQHAAGFPTELATAYSVQLPGAVGELTGELWAAEPVLKIDGDLPEWMDGAHAWLVADFVSAGKKDPHLQWNSLSSTGEWALAAGGHDPLEGYDCAYVQPIPEVSGAVFLVVEGVDADALALATPNMDLATGRDEVLTWIYLGEAGAEPEAETPELAAPAIDPDGYLTTVTNVRAWPDGLRCDAMINDPNVITGSGDASDHLAVMPVPRVVPSSGAREIKIPLVWGDSSEFAAAVTTPFLDTSARLVLRQLEESWVFDASWSGSDEYGDWQLTLIPFEGCGSTGPVEGEWFNATLYTEDLRGTWAWDLGHMEAGL